MQEGCQHLQGPRRTLHIEWAGQNGEVGGATVCNVCSSETLQIIIQVPSFSTEKGRFPVYNDAVPGSGTCYFDSRFCVGLGPNNFEIIPQVGGTFPGSGEGQYALIACFCLDQLIFQMLVDLYSRAIFGIVARIHIGRGMIPLDKSKA